MTKKGSARSGGRTPARDRRIPCRALDPTRARLLVEQVYRDVHHEAGGYSRENGVVVYTNPVVARRRRAEVIHSDVRDNVHRLAALDGKSLPAMPVVHVVTVRPPILALIEPLVVPVLVVIPPVLAAMLTAVVIVIVVAPLMVVTVMIVIPGRIGESHRARQQREGHGRHDGVVAKPRPCASPCGPAGAGQNRSRRFCHSNLGLRARLRHMDSVAQPG